MEAEEEYAEEYGEEFYTEDSDMEDDAVFKSSPKRQTLKVYCISHKETKEIIYVGRTSRSFAERWWAHTHASTQPVKYYMLANGGFEMYSMQLLITCYNMRDFVEWESHLILEMNPRCNVQGIYRKPVKTDWGKIRNILKRRKH